MSGYRAMGCLCLYIAVWGDENTRHQSKRTIALSDNIGLDISIIVLACPNEASVALDGVGDHVINQTMLIPELLLFELCSVSGLVDLLEDVLEATIILLHDRVLGAHVQGVVALQSILERGMSESSNRLISVIHAHQHTRVLKVVGDHFDRFLGLVFWSESDLELSCFRCDKVRGTILITEGMSANDDWLGPSWHESGHVVDNDGLTEDGSIELVTDGSIGRLVHGLEIELLDSGLVRGNGGTLDSNLVLLDCIGSIQSHLVVGCISVLHAEVVVVDLEIQVRQDKRVLDLLPDDSGHLITIHFDNGILDYNLGLLGLDWAYHLLI